MTYGNPRRGEKYLSPGDEDRSYNGRPRLRRTRKKGCGKEAAPFFYAMARTKSGDLVEIETGLKQTWSNGVMECWSDGIQKMIS